jgi:hypothetical protein
MNEYDNVCDDPNPIRKRMHLDMGRALGAWRGGQHTAWKDLVDLAAKYRGRQRQLLDALGADRFHVRHPDEVSWDDMVERVRQLAAQSNCSCDHDPIECGHEAAAGHYEEKARQLGDLVSQIYRITLFGPDGETVRNDIVRVLLAAQKSGVIDASGNPAATR